MANYHQRFCPKHAVLRAKLVKLGLPVSSFCYTHNELWYEKKQLTIYGTVGKKLQAPWTHIVLIIIIWDRRW